MGILFCPGPRCRDKALKKIDEALDPLSPYIVVLHETDRVKTPHTREAFEEATRALHAASRVRPT